MEPSPPDDANAREALTRELEAIDRDDPREASRLLPLVYDELRRLAAARLAREASGQTLQPTALVHEAYLRLIGPNPARAWDGKAHFYAAAAQAMRRILIDRARDRKRQKRGGDQDRRRLELDGLIAEDASPDDLIDLDEALGRLAQIDARGAELVKLRLYGGLSLDDAAAALGVVRRTAERDWAFARAWLFRQLVPPDSD